MSKFTLEKVEDRDEWDKLVDSSEQGTIFSYSKYLEILGDKRLLFFVKKGDVIKAGLHLMLSEDYRPIINDYVIYSGIIFPPGEEETRTSKLLTTRFAITSFIVDYLTTEYETMALSLAPQLIDIRPFLWFNYHESQDKKFFVDNRFTSYLDISELKEKINSIEDYNIFKNFEVLRQRNIRRAIREQIVVEEERQTDMFIDFYDGLMKGQGKIVSKDRLGVMANLINGLIDNNLASMFVGKTKDGSAAYITVFAYDKKRSYYLFGAGNPLIRDHYIGSFTFWSSFQKLAEKGIDGVDLEGINSPTRGAFKLSFGGTIVPYYELVKNSSLFT